MVKQGFGAFGKMKEEKQYIDDIIIAERRKWYENNNTPDNFTFFWGKNGYEQMREYLAAVIMCPHGLNCFTCDYGEQNVDRYLRKKPLRFMGADHRWDKRKKGFLLKVISSLAK